MLVLLETGNPMFCPCYVHKRGKWEQAPFNHQEWMKLLNVFPNHYKYVGVLSEIVGANPELEYSLKYMAQVFQITDELRLALGCYEVKEE